MPKFLPNLTTILPLNAVRAGVLACIALGISGGGLTVPAYAQSDKVAQAETESSDNFLIELNIDALQTRENMRSRAAKYLLENIQNAQAAKALSDGLLNHAQPAIQSSIALAISTGKLEKMPISLIAPLVSATEKADEKLRNQLNDALGRYADRDVLPILSAIVKNKQRTMAFRERVANMIGSRGTAQEVIPVLLDVIETPEIEKQLQSLAFKGLSNITSNNHGEDLARWKQWWEDNKNANEVEWVKGRLKWANNQLEKIKRDKAGLENRLNTTEEKLNTVNRRLRQAYFDLYYAQPEDKRSAFLLKMLKDPIMQIRQQGIELVDIRRADGQPIDKQVVDGLRLLINDRSVKLRTASISLLKDLNDAATVPLILEQMNTEPDLQVLDAILNFLKRDPNQKVVAFVLEKMETHGLRKAYIEVLTLAYRKGSLTDKARTRITTSLRTEIDGGQRSLNAIKLLMSLAKDNSVNEKIVKTLLSENDAKAKQAVLEAGFEDNNLPLAWLKPFFQENELQAKILSIYRTRGTTEADAIGMLNMNLQDQNLDAVRLATVLAIATKLDGAAFTKLRALAETAKQEDVELALLRLINEQLYQARFEAQRGELIILVPTRLAALDDYKTAIAAIDKILKANGFPTTTRMQLNRLLLTSALTINEKEKIALAVQALAEQKQEASDEYIYNQLVMRAKSLTADNKKEDAKFLLELVVEHLGDRLKKDWQSYLKRQQIELPSVKDDKQPAANNS